MERCSGCGGGGGGGGAPVPAAVGQPGPASRGSTRGSTGGWYTPEMHLPEMAAPLDKLECVFWSKKGVVACAECGGGLWRNLIDFIEILEV